MTNKELEVLQKSDEFLKYIYDNRMICNADDLMESLENTDLFEEFLEQR